MENVAYKKYFCLHIKISKIPTKTLSFSVLLIISFFSTFMVSCKKSALVNGSKGSNTINQQVVTLSTNSSNADTAVFHSGKEGYAFYRIPAIVTTLNGTILAFAEGRKNSVSDDGTIDVVMKRSTDGGRTWSPLQVVWADGNNTCGNSVPIVDQSTGDTHLVMGWSRGTDTQTSIVKGTGLPRKIYYSKSSDNGVTWSKVQEITSFTYTSTWTATGPGHGMQVVKGAYAGRLIVPTYLEQIKVTGQAPVWGIYMLYSDNHGASWKKGAMVNQRSTAANETTVAELTDGSLILNSRGTSITNRLSARSTDGGITWTPLQIETSLTDPQCEGSLLSASFSNSNVLFFSNNEATTRTNLMISESKDDGSTWEKLLAVKPGFTGYSDLSKISDQQLGILYEYGATAPYRSIRFKAYTMAN